MNPSGRRILLVAVAVAIGMPVGSVMGGVTLTDGNSLVEFNFGDEPGEELGMYEWAVDGVSHMYQQWFWYRVGETGGEASLDTLDMIGGPVIKDTSGDGNADAVGVTYGGAGLEVALMFILVGGPAGSEHSTILETIAATNVGTGTTDLHFFQYADFDLWYDAEFDSVEIIGDPKNTAIQWEGLTYVAETVATGAGGAPTHYEAGTWDDSPNSIWDRLQDSQPTTLNDLAGPIEDTDAVWAFQWDKVLGPGGSLVISKNKIITPEPATVALMGLGAAVALAGRRRPKR